MEREKHLLFTIRDIYEKGGNIIEYLKQSKQTDINSIEDIMISYDFQAGTYIKYADHNKEYVQAYTGNLFKVISSLGKFDSILEVGVGEATTLANLLLYFSDIPKYVYGFDISWSRIKYGLYYLSKLGLTKVQLATGDIFACPFRDNSIDIVYTSHSIEPNGGKEKEALRELFRITKYYLVLLEPSFDFADEEGRTRMLKNGYVTNLYKIAKELGYNIIEHRLFDVSSNRLNPTGLIVIKKSNNNQHNLSFLCCPLTYTNLDLINGCYYSKDAFLAYPVIDKVPCLLPQNAIIATHFLDEL